MSQITDVITSVVTKSATTLQTVMNAAALTYGPPDVMVPWFHTPEGCRKSALSGTRKLSVPETLGNVEERLKWVKKTLHHYPDHVPIVLERCEGSRLGNLSLRKFLVPGNITPTDFTMKIRKKLFEKDTLSSTSALLIVTHTGKSIYNTDTMSNIYRMYGNPEDRILYLVYKEESIFG